MLALLTAGYWGGRGHWIVRRRGNVSRVTFEPPKGAGSTQEWELPVEDLDKLVDALEAEAVDDLPAYNPFICDGMQYEYVRLTRAGGRRVYMNNPGLERGEGERSEDVYARVTSTFQALYRTRPR